MRKNVKQGTERQTVVVGDIIRSKKFAFGWGNTGFDANHPIEVGDHSAFGRKDVKLSKKQYLRKHFTEAFYPIYDGARGTAAFIVEKAGIGGGGAGNDQDSGGFISTDQDHWHVIARRLHDDGTYDLNGELIHFKMTGMYEPTVWIEDIEVIGKVNLPKPPRIQTIFAKALAKRPFKLA